jgi:diadenosine tetraphosphate (Ap4A) HIT family hydrolase
MSVSLQILGCTAPAPRQPYPDGLNSCPFCIVERGRILFETEHALALPDGFPVAEGHTLVVPRRHVATLYELSANEQNAVWELVSQVRKQLVTRLAPDGFNIGINDGLAAGQTVMHAHVHIIPRWKGDVPDPRGGIRSVLSAKAAHWKE